VKVYEWNGSMIHAKTAVADGRWARVGSSNLNVASWLTNCEIDVAVENEGFAQKMATQYEQDLLNATEVVLDAAEAAHAATRIGMVPAGGCGGTRLAAVVSTGDEREAQPWTSSW